MKNAGPDCNRLIAAEHCFSMLSISIPATQAISFCPEGSVIQQKLAPEVYRDSSWLGRCELSLTSYGHHVLADVKMLEGLAVVEGRGKALHTSVSNLILVDSNFLNFGNPWTGLRQANHLQGPDIEVQ